jgi:hypothetical protein
MGSRELRLCLIGDFGGQLFRLRPLRGHTDQPSLAFVAV